MSMLHTNFIEWAEGRLLIPEGLKFGQPLKFAGFQKRFLRGALKAGVSQGCLSVARGNGKSALIATLALAELLGRLAVKQPRREIIVAARTRDQGGIIIRYILGFARSFSPATQKRLTYRKAPHIEIEYDGKGGPHVIRAVSSDGRAVLGTSPTLVICDERASWRESRAGEMQAALQSGLGKRNGRFFAISTTADSDAHAFSQLIDDSGPGIYNQEHRPEPNLPVDDVHSLLIANPGATYGIGASKEWLLASARRAIKQGGSSLTSFRLYNRNERVSAETRDVLLTVDQWLACETQNLPPREGQCVVGFDLGGSASMSCAAYYWPDTNRLEVKGWFANNPTLKDRGEADGVGGQYSEMANRKELHLSGVNTVPVASWIIEVLRHVDGKNIACLVYDRYKQAEISEALMEIGCTFPIVWRWMGYKDGSEDVGRFQRACFDQKVRSKPSLLLRAAFTSAVVL
ncbi:MAG: terminase large subunit [Rhodospirillales bacterium]